MDGCIVISLTSMVDACVYDEAQLSFMTASGIQYLAQMKTDNNGFYDWLRDSQKNILGVRWFSFDESSFETVIQSLSHSCVNLVSDTETESFMLFFSDKVAYDESLSCDQSFGNNNLYKAGNQVSMSFSLEDIDSLDEFYGLTCITLSNQFK